MDMNMVMTMDLSGILKASGADLTGVPADMLKMEFLFDMMMDITKTGDAVKIKAPADLDSYISMEDLMEMQMQQMETATEVTVAA